MVVARTTNVENDIENPPDTRDLEIQDFRRQVEILTWHLEQLKPRGQQFMEESSSDMGFYNPFHNRSPVRNQQDVGRMYERGNPRKGSQYEDDP